ncbi:LysR family transcriptional regulator [Citricoccus sp.]|uniref:LysR family transcriptional regulator n=1 Tax=Citricoccus sp. TaxID=1978372 RepID=UPI0026295EC0|nr:LysR family transcriptional regulator [Citricoccus sp.]HRO31014.1 LysR family transcriptional regulator [Citricoccus sp.]HRO93169.1 LysR family transcriptional regulator [Citricoccus sp.]
MLDVRRLVLLRELSIRGTMTAVARAMNLAPSSVSEQLALLERETKTVLLRRAGRTVQLTEAALALVERTDPILDALEQAEAALVSTGEEVTGRVTLAVFQSAALTLLPPALTLLRTRHPGLRLEVVQYEPETALHETWARDFDVVVAEQYPGHSAPHWPGLDRRPLLRDELQLAVPSSLDVDRLDAGPGTEVDVEPGNVVRAAEPGTASDTGRGAEPRAAPGTAPDGRRPTPGAVLQALLAHRPLPWVMEPRGTATRHWAEQVCRSAGHEPDVRYVSSDLQSHLALVESGNAVALLPGLILVGSRVRLRRIPLDGRPMRTVFTSTRSSTAGSPAVVAVRSVLEEAAGDLGLGTASRTGSV